MDKVSQIRVLAVDDEAAMLRSLHRALTPLGFAVDMVTSGAEAVTRARRERHDVYLVDIKMEPHDGLWTCRELVAIDPTATIIVLSGDESEEAQVAALDAGATDFVIKPFRPAELNSRMRLRIRQSLESSALRNKLQIGSLVADRATKAVRIAGATLPLTDMETELFWLLVRSPGKFYTAQELHDAVSESSQVNSTRKALQRLRDKLGEHGDLIRTVRKRGYCFDARKG